MSRKTKFKIWDKERQCWYEPIYEAYRNRLYEIFISPGGDLCRRTMDGIEHESRFPDRYELVEFTGLHDKQGAEIYAGDILNISYEWRSFMDDVDDEGFYRGVVHFRPSSGYGLASVTTRSSVDGSIEKRRGLKNIVTSNAVVIGNVYEHPELLEVAE